MKLQDRRRLVNWWIGWEDLNWPSPDTQDRIRRRAEKLAKADVTTAILFGAHFRWDYLPYFTLLHDHIAAVAEELHKYNIELFDRHSVNLIHRYDTREQMRHVMLHSGPHLPFSPSREAAACWEYHGHRLNDWRMIDVRDRSPLYYPQYAAEGFCYRNPDYLEAYLDYATDLVATTGIDGLAAEDPVHYMHFNSCACPHCRAELKRRTGVELPPIEDRDFWGNWNNPAWNAWIDLRYDAGKEFFEKLSARLPKDFPLTTCGANSASYSSVGKACDAKYFIAGGSNYVHSEMSGNTPPYKHDPVTANIRISDRMVNFSHHQAVARERGIRSFSTGYGFTEPSANIIWAVNKVLDTDCCFSTLKARLGLPKHILKTLPDEADVIGRSFAFEKAHPMLFEGEQVGQVGVYYSSDTRDHTMFGNLHHGYYRDYSHTLRELFSLGICAHTVFTFPSDTEHYPVILVPSAVRMSQEEIAAMEQYLAVGGRVIMTGPSAIASCATKYALPSRPTLENPLDFFDGVAHGVWHKFADWITQTEIPPCNEEGCFCEIRPGLFYNPCRVIEKNTAAQMLTLCRGFIQTMPIHVEQSEGYLITVFRSANGIAIHLLAEDYDVDIDHHLDEIRYHRSRVNFVNYVAPIGVSEKVSVRSAVPPQVFTPFCEDTCRVKKTEGGYDVVLPKNTSYLILFFPLA